MPSAGDRRLAYHFGYHYFLQVCFRRCVACVCQKPWRDIIILFCLTFGVVLPFMSLRLRHTMYDRFLPKNEAGEKMKLMQENTKRLNVSALYLKRMGETDYYKKLKLNLERRNFGGEASLRPNISLAITVITVSRNRHVILDYEPKYLTQTLASFLRLVNSSSFASMHFSVGLFVCNVDPQPDSYAEVKSLPSWIKVFQRFHHNSVPLSNMRYDDKIEKEKQDYVFCLEQSLSQNVSHVLLVEDDALPLPDLFPVIDRLIFSNFDSIDASSSNSVLYFKLYHPERLLGYISLEFERIPELLSISCLFSMVLVRMYTKWGSRIESVLFLWTIFFIYSGLTLLALGRVNVIEFRRVSRFLYQLTPAPSCCTPAMLFPSQGGRLVADYLNSVTCRSKFAKDTALDEFRRKKSLTARMIQPNLFQHIGQFSSLRSELVNPYIV